MQFKLALLAAFVPALVAAAPLEKRQGGIAVVCGSWSYTASNVNTAVNNGLSGKYDSSSYPHTYNNYEGFNFSPYCSSGPYVEYPLTYAGYTGGSPGADCVIYNPNTGRFCGAITHIGASSTNGFVKCKY